MYLDEFQHVKEVSRSQFSISILLMGWAMGVYIQLITYLCHEFDD